VECAVSFRIRGSPLWQTQKGASTRPWREGGPDPSGCRFRVLYRAATPPRIGPDLAGRATANHASAKAGETEVNTGEGPGRREGLAQNRSCSAIAPVGSADHRGAWCQCPCGCTSWAREGAPGTSSRARTGWGHECYSLAIKAGEDSSGQSSDVLSTYGDVCGFRVRAGQANDESTIRQKEGRAHVRSKSMWVSAPGRCGYWPLTTCLAR
jgi:hypothetical protein